MASIKEHQWKRKWNRLPILNRQLFSISSFHAEESVRHLLNVVDECDQIFSKYAVRIPTKYRTTLDSIQSQHSPAFSSSSMELSITTAHLLYLEHGDGIGSEMFFTMLSYFYSIGHAQGAHCITLLIPRVVCTHYQMLLSSK